MSELRIDDRLWSAKARNLSPYVPGEQPQHDNLCKLNTNENPFPPSPTVAAAISQVLADQADELRLYPAPESDDLRQALAEWYQLDSNQVFVGNGSDEVLALVFASFFMKERPVLTPDISYSFYPVYAQTFAVELVKIALAADFSVDPDSYRQPCSGIIIANPNAPTGILLALADIRKLVSEHPNAVIVIDEAYIDFAATDDNTAVSAITLINEFDNLLVTQTFSKSRSLAGLRVGMAFGNLSLIEALTRMKNSFNSYPLDKLAQAGARASVLDSDYFEQTCQTVINLRESLTAELTELGYQVLPSQANFVFARPKQGHASEVASKLREQGIIVRHFDKPRIEEYLRITVGMLSLACLSARLRLDFRRGLFPQAKRGPVNLCIGGVTSPLPSCRRWRCTHGLPHTRAHILQKSRLRDDAGSELGWCRTDCRNDESKWCEALVERLPEPPLHSMESFRMEKTAKVI